MSKGMTKTVALIVAATVLLITAVIVIFMTEGGLGDFMDSSQGESCSAQVAAKCSYGSSNSFPTPSSCKELGSEERGAIADASNDVQSIDQNSVECVQDTSSTTTGTTTGQQPPASDPEQP